MQRCEDRQGADLGEHVVVDHHRVCEARAPVDDAVGDQLDSGRVELAQRRGHGRLVIGDAARLADPLDEAVRERLAPLEVDQPVLQRRRAAVEDEDAQASCAWIAVIATVFTMSATVAPRERSFTGLRSPCSTGPIATAPALR